MVFSRYRHLLRTVAVLVMAFALGACGGSGERPATTTTSGIAAASVVVTDPASGVSFRRPPGWSNATADGLFRIYIDPPTTKDYRRNILLLVEPFTGTLQEYTQLGDSQYRQLPDFIRLDSEQTTLAGLAAHREVNSFTKDGQQLQSTGIWTLKGGKAYGFTYVSDPDRFESQLPAFEQLLDSVRLP